MTLSCRLTNHTHHTSVDRMTKTGFKSGLFMRLIFTVCISPHTPVKCEFWNVYDFPRITLMIILSFLPQTLSKQILTVFVTLSCAVATVAQGDQNGK